VLGVDAIVLAHAHLDRVFQGLTTTELGEIDQILEVEAGEARRAVVD